MKQIYMVECVLTTENIEKLIMEITQAYLGSVKPRKAVPEIKFRVGVEEVLLNSREYYGTDSACKILLGKSMGKYFLDISQKGERKSPVNNEDDTDINNYILSKFEVCPRYVYSRTPRGNYNHIIWESVEREKKNGMLTSMVYALIFAAIFGIIINCIPDDIHNMISKDLVSPILAKLTSIFAAMATPLVFFAVVEGIFGIGDVSSFGGIGSKILKRMGFTYFIAQIFMIIGGVIGFGVAPMFSATSEESAMSQVVQMVLDIIPGNLVLPFALDNDLQVIVIAIFVGIAMLILDKKLIRLGEIVKEGSELINTMMLICCKLLPLIVFFGVTNIIITSKSSQFASIGRMFAVFMCANAVFMLSMAIRTRVVTKTPLKYIIPKQFATFLINITTASQVAALPENMKCCKDKFGIDSKIVDFGLPLGIVIYMPSGAIFLAITVWGLMYSMGMPVTIAMIIRIAVVCAIVAIAAPPIPGSALVVLPALFAACGMPNDALPMAIIFGTIVGYIIPAMNGYNIQLELLMSSKKLGKVDDTKLKSKYSE